MSETTAELAEQLRQRYSGPMSDEEVAFLRDVQGFIDFMVRNGLSFVSVSVLLQDLNELVRERFDYARAKERGFTPKVSKYSRITPESFGGSEED